MSASEGSPATALPTVPKGIPPAEVEVDEDLVRALLRDQHPDLADLPVHPYATGWDNVTFRLGDEFAVRMPRISGAVPLLRSEQRWLPLLAEMLPVPVPVPVRAGVAGPGYPWPWSVLRWVPGRSAEHGEPAPGEAPAFGRFLAALHRPAPAEAPRSTYRGVPLNTLDSVARRLALLPGLTADLPVDWTELARFWDAAREVPCDVPETWVHGDLHPKNIVVDDGRFAAVLDWGDMSVGDRATDLAAAWMLFPVTAHDALWEAYGPVSESTRTRALGWALFFGTMLLETGIANDPPFAEIGRRTLTRVAASL